MIDYLRISVTDRCNLNCLYCQPMAKRKVLSHNEVLRYEEIIRIVKCFAKSGISKIRITGGEPLVKKDISTLIKVIKEVENIKEVALTTNGVLLEKMAISLKENKLDRINISIDSLDRRKYQEITGFDKLEAVLRGIKVAQTAGFNNLKLNVVLLQNFNDNEILDFVDFAAKNKLILRFIELFETNREIFDFTQKAVPSEYIQQVIEDKYGKLNPVILEHNNGPSDNFHLPGKDDLKIGFISNNTTNFCQNCTRLRMNCAGKISPCLFSGFIHDLGKMVKKDFSDQEITQYINDIIKHKSDYSKTKNRCGSIEMSNIGG